MPKFILTAGLLFVLIMSANAQNTSPAVEINLFNAFIGITDVKFVIPAKKTDNNRGYWIAGLYFDYAWGSVSRAVDKYGKVKQLQAQFGWRQLLWKRLTIDGTINIGPRHEEKNIYDGSTLNSLDSRLYIQAGWSQPLSKTTYLKLGGGTGILLFRSGDKYASTEKKLIPAADLSFGVKL